MQRHAQAQKKCRLPLKTIYGVVRLLLSIYFAKTKHNHVQLGMPSCKKSAVFFNIVQKAFDPPLLSFEHYVVNFSEGILTKVRKRLSQQLSTK